MASLIMEEMSMGDMMTLLKLRRGKYSLVEEKIPANAKVLGQAIKDIRFPEQCVVAAIIRHGEIVVPRGVTTFEVDDEVLAVTDRKGAEQLAELFAPPGNWKVSRSTTGFSLHRGSPVFGFVWGSGTPRLVEVVRPVGT